MKEKQLLTVFILIFYILCFFGCSAEKKESLTGADVEKIQLLINKNIKDIPALKWNLIDGKLNVAFKFTSFEQQNIDMKMLEKVVSRAVQQILGPIPTDITVVPKPKVQKVTDECPGSNKILPIRLFIDKENKITAYGSEITEPYLASLFKSLPYGCKDARITFLYEKGASLKYIKRLNALLRNSGKYGHQSPILLEMPTENVKWNWQNSSNKVRVSGTFL
jgi:hypothetical protein